jgi:hypothetical protein
MKRFEDIELFNAEVDHLVNEVRTTTDHQCTENATREDEDIVAVALLAQAARGTVKHGYYSC